jgi:fermentation-respiration switch protein FrsA (DUF1100 family)
MPPPTSPVQPLRPLRPLVGPRTVAKRYATVALVAIVLGALHIRHRPATFCLFRELTGLPCPFCGGTTAAVRLGHGDLRGALGASPLAVLMLATWPLLDAVRPPRWWQNRRNRWLVIGAILIASEIWQLVRFGIISV